MKNLIFVDCEGHGHAPADLHDPIGFEFGAVHYPSRNTFHGKGASKETFEKFNRWLGEMVGKNRPIFVSDNPAYDWQFINYYFHKHLGTNPFGWSARRISDFYAGLVGDFGRTQDWKQLRITEHDHNPVHDAMGNLESYHALVTFLEKEKENGHFIPLKIPQI